MSNQAWLMYQMLYYDEKIVNKKRTLFLILTNYLCIALLSIRSQLHINKCIATLYLDTKRLNAF